LRHDLEAQPPPKTELALSLKEQLDKIDEKFGREIYNGFFESRLKIEIGMWEKGKAICDFLKKIGQAGESV
jgi:intein-encoded DNA endonuclease-like protein